MTMVEDFLADSRIGPYADRPWPGGGAAQVARVLRVYAARISAGTFPDPRVPVPWTPMGRALLDVPEGQREALAVAAADALCVLAAEGRTVADALA